jgi:hypothetical protein
MYDVPDLLRHAVATLAYRAAKPLRDPPPDFAETRASPTGRTAVEIVAHLADLIEWANRGVAGQMEWRPMNSGSLERERERFFSALAVLDRALAAGTIACPPNRLFQGPIADALTHVGQLAMLRRIVGSPVRGENYYVADICMGTVGLEQAPGKIEFD